MLFLYFILVPLSKINIISNVVHLLELKRHLYESCLPNLPTAIHALYIVFHNLTWQILLCVRLPLCSLSFDTSKHVFISSF